ncbi:MAG: CdaR family protein [Treponema sp.]|nr:CdaR family protein [Treponema sp.]
MNIRTIASQAVENWPAKVLSIALAIMLFVFHRMSALEERFFSIPLSIDRNGPLVPSASFPRMIRVTMRGEPNSIFSILESDIEVYIDMNRIEQPGVYTVPVQWRKRSVMQGAEPVQITVDPMEITLSLDHRISRAVPVTADLRGQIDTGHVMTQHSLNPAEVIIEGPAGLISGIPEIFTEAINLSGRQSDFLVVAAILSPDPLMIIRGSGTSEFRGSVRQIISVRNIATIPIAITGLPPELAGKLEPAAANIRIEGTNQAALQAFAPGEDFLRIDASDIDSPGEYIVRVLTAPAENMSISVEPGEVRLSVSVSEGE